MSPREADLPAIPFPGIEPFTYAERKVFFARAAEARRLVRLIALYRGVLLYAASGVGKSSLVNAGLIPLIVEEGHHPERLRVQPRLGEEVLIDPPASFPSVLTGTGGRGVLSTEAFLAKVRDQAKTSRPLLVFDQFEEWVTLFQEVSVECREQVRRCRERVLDLIVTLVRDPELPVKVLIVLREDYLASLQPLFERCPTLPDNFLRLCPLDPGQLQHIIRGPFEKHPGCYTPEIEPDLAETIAAQIAQRAGPEGVPLTEVQIVCRSLFEAGLDGKEPARVFAEAGGVQGVLERFLEGALDSLGPKLRDPATALLGGLITSAGTRNVINRDDLLDRVATEDEIPRDQLAGALDGLEGSTRLVRKELRREVYFYEIVSEFLVDWIRQQAERRRLARVQRANRRLRRFVAGLGVGLLAVAGLAIFAGVCWRAAERQKQLRISQILAEESGDALTESVPRALLLANESIRRARLAGAGDSARAEESLRRALARSPGHILGGDGAPAFEAAMSPDGRWVAATGKDGTVSLWRLGPAGLEDPPARLTGYRGRLAAAAVSPRGRRLAIVGEERNLVLWDLGSPTSPPRMLTAEVPLDTVRFSPDSRWLMAAGQDDAPQVWRVLGEAPAAAKPLRRRGCKPTRWSYSPRLRWVAIGCDNGAAVLWDLRGPEPKPWDVPSLREEVSALAFDPDETRLAIGGLDGSVRLWLLDGHGPEEVSIDLMTEPHEVTALAFHSKGEQLAVAFVTGSLKLWQIGRVRPPSSEPVQAAWDPHAGLVWSSNGRWLLSRGPGDESRLWALSPAGEIVPARSLDGEIRAAAFSPDSRWLATGDSQGRLRRMDLRQPAGGFVVLRAHEGPVISLVFGAGNWALSRGTEEPARLWELGAQDPARSDEPRILHGPGKAPPATARPRAAGPGGTWRLEIQGDTPVLQESAGGDIVLRRHQGGVTAWAWSGDGRWLLTGGADGAARLWDLERVRALVREKLPPEPAGLFAHRSGVTAALFSPGSRRLVTLGENAVLWRLDGEVRQNELTGHPGVVVAADISRDSRWLATGDDRGTVRLWDLAAGLSSVNLPGPGTRVTRLWFDPAGRWLFTTISDGALHRWRVPLDELMDLACRTAGRNLTPQEWDQILGGEEHRGATCPDFDKNGTTR